METITIKVGKYRFEIIDETLSVDDQIYSRVFKISGNVSDYAHISIRYDKNQPVSAHINFGESNACISDVLLERTKYITMVKTLLSVFHVKIPTITELSFEDNSNIECATNVYRHLFVVH